MKKIILIFIGILFIFCNPASCTSIEKNLNIPIPLSIYENIEAAQNLSLGKILLNRIMISPFNLVASLIFLAAILHTFFAPKILKFAQELKKKYGKDSNKSYFWAEILHFCGEIEVIFGLWCIPLLICMWYTFGWDRMTHYFHNVANYAEPIFVVVIMSIAATKPILVFAENILKYIAKLGKCTPGAWWLTILIISPLMGSFITEPAAMTIGAMLLSKQFYALQPSNVLKYATLGLLFVNVSVGGTLTHFAAPPILMVVSKWSLSLSDVFIQFGKHAITGIIINTFLYYIIFYKEFQILATKKHISVSQEKIKIPLIITIIHILFLSWTVINLHTPSLVIAGFLFFLGFVKITNFYQDEINIKNPLLVGFFLAGLVTHGGFQSWWLSPVLSSLNETSLFLGATILTAFNDNAAITYLASLVPIFSANKLLQKAILAGAVTGGGLTVIANAPNPAGQNILSKYFPQGISPAKLFLSAILPTTIIALCFLQ